MVDVVNTVTGIQGTPPRASSQSVASVSATEATSNSGASASGFVSSAIRVDNLQNVTILEYRSSRTGEVVQQYPSQSQIDAFKRAQQIVTHDQQSHTEEGHTTQPAPQTTQTTAPATPSPQPSIGNSGSGSTGGGDTATSITV